MTLILSLATQNCVFQVGDRRLMGTDGHIYTDRRNKLTWFNGRVAFGYTGLAHVMGQRTDHWLAKTLSDKSCTSNSAAAQFLASAATHAIRETSIPSNVNRWQVIRTAFVAVGWSFTQENIIRPIIYRVSNFHDKNDKPLSTAEDEFSVRVWLPRRNERYLFLESGQSVPRKLTDLLRKRVRQQIKAKRPRMEILRHLVKIMRATAVRNKMVGQELLSVCIPKMSADKKEFFLTTGGPQSDCSTFQVWPAHHSEPKQHGPAAVFGGGAVLTGFQAGILGPPPPHSLGGLVVINGQPQTLKYPCCVLFNDLTNCYMSARPENSNLDYLAIFTNEQAMVENLRRSSDRLVRVFLNSATELERLLNSVRGVEMVILNPNSPVSGITFSNALAQLLQALKKSTT